MKLKLSKKGKGCHQVPKFVSRLKKEIAGHSKHLVMKNILLFAIVILSGYVTSCSSSNRSMKGNAAQATKGLRDYYKEYFTMGVAVSAAALRTDESKLIIHQFTSITPENAMKMATIHPKENEYNWNEADSIVAFAQHHKMKIRGHCLVWHNQAPDWMFVKDGQPVSKEILLERLKAHMQNVVGRYKGKIYAWDVVNEAISDAPDTVYRQSAWYKICGDDYIAKAFEYAHEADPDALLFYNDYNEIEPVKRVKIIRMIKDLQAKNVPIDGVGLQAHWAIDEPSKAQLEQTLQDYSILGIAVQITELDISIYPKKEIAEKNTTDQPVAFNPEKEVQQAAMYSMCFDLFRKYKHIISAVTFWNISDRYSWLDNFTEPNRKDFPLLFDAHLKPKQAFWEVVHFK